MNYLRFLLGFLYGAVTGGLGYFIASPFLALHRLARASWGITENCPFLLRIALFPVVAWLFSGLYLVGGLCGGLFRGSQIAYFTGKSFNQHGVVKGLTCPFKLAKSFLSHEIHYHYDDAADYPLAGSPMSDKEREKFIRNATPGRKEVLEKEARDLGQTLAQIPERTMPKELIAMMVGYTAETAADATVMEKAIIAPKKSSSLCSIFNFFFKSDQPETVLQVKKSFNKIA